MIRNYRLPRSACAAPPATVLTTTPPSEVPKASQLPSLLMSKQVHGYSDTLWHETSCGSSATLSPTLSPAPGPAPATCPAEALAEAWEEV